MAFADARRDRCVLIDANPDRGTLGTSFARGHTVYVDDVRAAAERPDLSPSDLDGMLAHRAARSAGPARTPEQQPPPTAGAPTTTPR